MTKKGRQLFRESAPTFFLNMALLRLNPALAMKAKQQKHKTQLQLHYVRLDALKIGER